jgi:hypothetical protein
MKNLHQILHESGCNQLYIIKDLALMPTIHESL